MVERQHDDAMTDANPLGALSDACEENLRRRAVRKFVEEMILDGPDRVEAEPIGELDLLHRFPEHPILVIAACGLIDSIS